MVYCPSSERLMRGGIHEGTRNGAVDDAAFQRDGIHLSESGTDRLLRNLDLPNQPVRRKQRLPQHRQVAMTSSARHSQANNAETSPASPDNA